MAFWDFLTRDVIVAINALERKAMAALDDLRTEVRETKTVAESADRAMDGLSAKLDEALAGGLPAVQQLADELRQIKTDLAASVAENTSAATEPQPQEGAGGTPLPPGARARR